MACLHLDADEDCGHPKSTAHEFMWVAMSEQGQIRSFGDVGSVSGLPERELKSDIATSE
jgi:hypothetical protein